MGFDIKEVLLLNEMYLLKKKKRFLIVKILVELIKRKEEINKEK